MEFKEALAIPASTTEAWRVLDDVSLVVQCIPGAELVAELEGGDYEGIMTVRFGPKIIRFEGRAAYERNDLTKVATVTGSGNDAKTRTKAKCTIALHVIPGDSDDACVVDVDCQIQFGGPLASMIDAGGKAIGSEMIADFGVQLTAKIKSESGGDTDGANAANIEATPSQAGAAGVNVSFAKVVPALVKSIRVPGSRFFSKRSQRGANDETTSTDETGDS